MARKISKIPEGSTNVVLLAMAADIPGSREAAETIAEYAEDRVQNGHLAEALDWFSRIVEGGEPELGPHAALRIGGLLVDSDMEAAQAALRYAADHGVGQVREFAAANIETLSHHGIPPRVAAASADEVIGRVALGRGRLWMVDGELEAACDAFEQAGDCPVAEVAIEGMAYLGSAHTQLGNHEAALEPLERAVASAHPRFGAMAAVDLATILAARGDRSRAVEMLRWARGGQGPTAAMAGVNLGVILSRELGELAGGVAALREAANSDEPLAAAAASFNLGALLEDNGDLPGAREAYERAIELRQPGFSGQAAMNLGIMLFKQMDIEGARRALRHAVELGGLKDAAGAQQLLDQLGGLGDVDDLQALAEDLDLNDPDVVGGASIEAGMHFLGVGDIAGAMRTFERAMDTGHQRHSPQAAASVALIFWHEHGVAGAEVAIGRLDEIGMAELKPRAWFLFGKYMLRSGEFGTAEEAWRRIPSSTADAYAAAVCALWILRGDAAKAEAAFGHVLTIANDLAGNLTAAVLELGDAHAERGDRPTARQAYELGCRMADRLGEPHLIKQAREALNSAP